MYLLGMLLPKQPLAYADARLKVAGLATAEAKFEPLSKSRLQSQRLTRSITSSLFYAMVSLFYVFVVTLPPRKPCPIIIVDTQENMNAVRRIYST